LTTDLGIVVGEVGFDAGDGMRVLRRREVFVRVRYGTLAKLEGVRGLTIREVQARTGIRIETLVKELKTLPHLADSGDRRWIHVDTLTDFRRRAMEFLDRYAADVKQVTAADLQRVAKRYLGTVRTIIVEPPR